MRTRSRSVLAMAAAACVLAAPGPVGRDADSASGDGSIRFGDQETGRGYFTFEVDAGNTGNHGRFLFGAEDHHSYPDVVIRVQKILRVEISGRTVRIKAQGHLQETPVVVKAVAVDNVGTGDLDEFSVETVPLHGDDGDEGHFHASGKVFKGDVHVGALD